MLLRKTFLAVLMTLVAVTTVCTAAPAQAQYRGERIGFAGEGAMIEAINAMSRAHHNPLASIGHVRAAQGHLRTALRVLNNQSALFQLQAAAASLDSFSVTGDRFALQNAMQHTEQALAMEQQTRLVPRGFQPRVHGRPDCDHPHQPGFPSGPVPYSSGYFPGASSTYPYPYGFDAPVPHVVPATPRGGISFQRGPFSITIPLR
jgi:hypothetical protein